MPSSAQRLIAGGARALALEVSEGDTSLGVGRETAEWLTPHHVVFHLVDRERARPLAAFLASAGCAPTEFSFPSDSPGIDCAFEAPWTIVSLAQLVFLSSLRGVSFPDFTQG